MDTPLKVTFISRSDLRGGAAIVTYRLVEALRAEGVDARMLVCEKMSDSDFVEVCASQKRIQYSFLKERLGIFLRNGMSRRTLFKIDNASEGLPLADHPWVKDADGIALGWVNQGMLSLNGVKKIYNLDKPIVWMMHDMWNMTGICHHAGDCTRYHEHCGNCPLLGPGAGPHDMSRSTWRRKKYIYSDCDIRFVAVSNWLAGKARQSSLMKDTDLHVIPNPFNISAHDLQATKENKSEIRIIFGAARLDDPIKGLPVLKKALQILAESQQGPAKPLHLITFGSIKDSTALDNIAISHTHLGILNGEVAIADAYRRCDIVVSSSDFETLPGTLVEGQAYGCIPVAFDHGGQSDIIDHKLTGYLAEWDEDTYTRARRLAEGILWAAGRVNDNDLKKRMRESVEDKFGAPQVARRFLKLLLKNT